MRIAALVVVLVACGKRDVDWSGHSAFRNCVPVIDAWHPGDDVPPCSALHMCANEAHLTPEQSHTLDAMIAAARPVCPPP